MDVIVYGIGNLIGVAILLAKFIVPILILFFVGKKLNRWHFDKLLPLLFLCFFISWAGYSYYSFSSLCTKVPKTIFYFTPDSKPEGFMLNDIRNASTGYFNAEAAIQVGNFQWIEKFSPRNKKFQRRYLNKKNNTRRLPLEESISEYSLTIFPMEQINSLIFAPIYLYKVQVIERASDRVLAESTELVFGGGFLGTLMRIKGGDQDYGYHSCGYISQQIGPWRPTLSTRKQVQEYDNADVTFITRALTPDSGG
jgi:hypothetical protein